MEFQEYVAQATQRAFDEAFKFAKDVPADKLAWKPLDEGRSVIDQLQELAQSPEYAAPMITGEQTAETGDKNEWQRLREQRAGWTTIEDCERELNARLPKLLETIRNCPDERLDQTIWLPYDGGRDFTIREILEYPRWNATYHGGQIGYIQTLYGDKEMR